MKKHIGALARVVRYAKVETSDPIDEFSPEYDEMMRRAMLALQALRKALLRTGAKRPAPIKRRTRATLR